MPQEHITPSAEAVLERYEKASAIYSNMCCINPSEWHRPDTTEFTELRGLLAVHAEGGNVRCQYALASIYWQGLCSNAQFTRDEYLQAIEKATLWWVAAAAQGFWPAIDNLVTSGIGPEAERAKQECRKLEKDRPNLIGRQGNMPVYGPEFMQELCKRCYPDRYPDAVFSG